MGARCPKQNPIVIIVLSEVLKETFAPGTEVVIEGTRLKMMTWRLKSAESVPLPLSPLLWGLTKFPGFNGLHGTVVSLDSDTGRWPPRILSFNVEQVDWNGARSGYNVQLSSADGSTGQSAKIKGENLRMLLVWTKWIAMCRSTTATRYIKGILSKTGW